MPWRPYHLRSRHPPHLDLDEILAWADAFHARTGRWPTCVSGAIPESCRETWSRVDSALRLGTRGLPGGSSLPAFLAERRCVLYRCRSCSHLPLTIETILQWADAYRARKGQWPAKTSGPIKGTTWLSIDTALRKGLRQLPGGSSLAQLLAERRGVRNTAGLAPLTIKQILAWADAYYQRTGNWPTPKSGSVEEAPGETWSAIQRALSFGLRGLPGGSSLARLLSRKRSRRNRKDSPKLTINRILSWADAYFARNGYWPRYKSGPIPEAEGETWCSVNKALDQGRRGFPGGSSLALLLAQYRGRRHVFLPPPLTEQQIEAWAAACFRQTGRRPGHHSGEIPGSGGETWSMIDGALRDGRRGLPGGSSLACFLDGLDLA